MATNKYFRNVYNTEKEQQFFQSLATEAIQCLGVDVLYIPREIVQFDKVLEEVKESLFKSAYPIEVYFPDNAQYLGTGNTFEPFGIRINNTTTVYMSKQRWKELGIDKPRPNEGDLIYIGDPSVGYGTFTNTMFQINSVDYQKPQWQYGANAVFSLMLETYTHTYEEFKTGVPVVDAMDIKNVDEIGFAVNQAVASLESEILPKSKKSPFQRF